MIQQGFTAKYERLIFCMMLILWLSPVWSVHFFVTGDGPCHLYNSKILLDWIRGSDQDMYRYFMYLNPNLDPNWLTNLIQVPLLALFPPALSEKIFYSLYLLSFAFGLRFLIRQINPNALFLSTLGLIFAWHHIVFKGFSNNTWSIAVWFWIVGIWMKYREAPFWKAVLIQLVFVFTGYLSHPIGFIYAGLMIACLLFSDAVFHIRGSGWKKAGTYLGNQLLRLFLAWLPALIAMLSFLFRRSWSADEHMNSNEVWKSLITMPALVDFNSREEIFAMAVSIGCIILLLVAAWHKIKAGKLEKTDGLFLFFLVVLYTIVYPPAGMLGGLDMPRRLVMLPLLAMIFCAATIHQPGKWLKMITLSFSGIISIGLLAIRLPIQRQISDYVEEVVSCKDKIPVRSTVMTLNYDWEPHNINGKQIVNREWLNMHSDCYIGAYKPVILADNYELNFGYFPLITKWETNFYSGSAKDQIPFENQPPRADFRAYREKTGIRIDYIIMEGYHDSMREHPFTKEIQAQLEADYKQIYTSAHGIARLYRHRSSFQNPWNRK